METTTQNAKEKKLETGKTGKRKFWNAFVKFLSMGGFLVILIAIDAIVILIEKCTK